MNSHVLAASPFPRNNTTTHIHLLEQNKFSQLPTHWHCNHWLPQIASQPQTPEASVATTIFGDWLSQCICIMLQPFQYSRKDIHQAKSEWKSAIRCTQWFSYLTALALPIILRRNIHPVLPPCKHVTVFRLKTGESLSDWTCSNLSCGNRASILCVLSFMPRKDVIGLGPSIFWYLMGKPRDMQVVNINSRLAFH